MSLDEKFVSIRTGIYDLAGKFFQKLAQLLGYPENPGMPTFYDVSNVVDGRAQFFNELPKRPTYFPPAQRPETWFETFFGPAPRAEVIPRYIYETKEEGYYNFYIENYGNLYFLPDWLSEFLQVRLNICLDISLLEIIREVLFIGLVLYSQMVLLRIAISWLIWINPYTLPWSYLAAAVDWTEDVLQGIVPSVLGVNVTGSVFLGALGAIADSLNHLVFTMPFLPSEAEETKLVINNEMKDVLVFHYLPILWYRYGIPNDILEFWHDHRPDILEYMQNAYKDLDIALKPDGIRQLTSNQFIGIESTKSLLRLLQNYDIDALYSLQIKIPDNPICHTSEFHDFCHSLFRYGIIERN
jgi:hypothetical protein